MGPGCADPEGDYDMAQIRKRGIGISALILAVLTMASVLASFSVAGAAAKPAGKPTFGGSITVGGSVPASLDPGTTATTPSAAPYYSLVYGQLFRISPKGVITPDLATSYALNAAGTTATLQLRHGVHFSDGTPFNAAAVKFTILRDQMGASTGTCPCAAFLTAVSSVTTKGSYTVQIHLSRRDALLQDVLTESEVTYIISPTAYASEGASGFGLRPVGAGPYQVSQYTPATTVTFSKWSGSYEHKTVYLSSITFDTQSSDAATLAGCESGTLAICSFGTTSAASSAQQAEADSNLVQEDSPADSWAGLHFNVDAPPFNNLLAREAVAYATDGTAIAQVVSGNSKATCYPMGAADEWWTAKCPSDVPTYNPAKAKALVQQLGGLSFNLSSIFNTPIYVTLATALQQEYEAVGMKVSLSIVSHPAWIADQADGNYQVVGPCCGGGFLDPYLGLQQYLSATGPANSFGYKSSQLNALEVRVETAKGPAQQKSLWAQYMDLDLQNVGLIGIIQGHTQNFVERGLHGVVFDGFIVYYDHAWVS